MTVHGAKGLEAPIVFLPDTCSAGSAASQGGQADQARRCARPARHAGAVRLAGQGHGRAGADPRQRATAFDAARARGAQPPALRRHDARARPALHRRLRRQARAGSGMLVRTDRATGLDGTLERATETRPAARCCVSQLRSSWPPEPPKATLSARRAPGCGSAGLGHGARAARAATHGAAARPRGLRPYDTDDEGEPLAAPPPRRSSRPSRLALEPAQARRAEPLPARHAHPRAAASICRRSIPRPGPGPPRRTSPSAATAFQRARCASIASADPRRADRSGLRRGLRRRTSQAEVPIVAVIPRPDGVQGRRCASRARSTAWRCSTRSVLIVDYKTNAGRAADPGGRGAGLSLSAWRPMSAGGAANRARPGSQGCPALDAGAASYGNSRTNDWIRLSKRPLAAGHAARLDA